MAKDTDVQQVIEDLDAGVLMERMGKILSRLGVSVLDLEKAGELTLKMKFKPMGARDQIMCEHDLSFKCPTTHGTASENTLTKTPLYVGTGGALSLYPEKQDDAFKGDERRPQETAKKPVSAPSLVGIPGRQEAQ